MGEAKNGECCGNNDCGCRTQSRGSGGVRTIAFFAIILLAAGTAVYSLYFKSADAGKPGCVPGEAAQPLMQLSSIPALNDRLDNVDFAFVILGEKRKVESISASIDSALIEIGSERAGMVTVEPENELFGIIAEEYTITGFPAVLALGRYGHRLLINSGITVETLIMSYKTSSTPPAPCC